jgi:hypothetical protein
MGNMDAAPELSVQQLPLGSSCHAAAARLKGICLWMQNHDKLRTLSTAAYGGTVIGESSFPHLTAHVMAFPSVFA